MIGELLGGLINSILKFVGWSTFGLSTIITVLNNTSSNARIRRKGFKIKPITDNSLMENIKYFIKDYGFLFIPVYNIIKSIKDTAKKDSEFDSQKIEELRDRDRIEEIKKEVEKPKEVKKEVKVIEEKKPEPKSITPAKEKTVEEMNCFERRDYYKKQYDFLVDLHKRAKSQGKSVNILNKIVRDIKVVVVEYNKAKKECDLIELNNEVRILPKNNELKLTIE